MPKEAWLGESKRSWMSRLANRPAPATTPCWQTLPQIGGVECPGTNLSPIIGDDRSFVCDQNANGPTLIFRRLFSGLPMFQQPVKLAAMDSQSTRRTTLVVAFLLED